MLWDMRRRRGWAPRGNGAFNPAYVQDQHLRCYLLAVVYLPVKRWEDHNGRSRSAGSGKGNRYFVARGYAILILIPGEHVHHRQEEPLACFLKVWAVKAAAVQPLSRLACSLCSTILRVSYTTSCSTAEWVDAVRSVGPDAAAGRGIVKVLRPGFSKEAVSVATPGCQRYVATEAAMACRGPTPSATGNGNG
jgi:hypothetical protein